MLIDARNLMLYLIHVCRNMRSNAIRVVHRDTFVVNSELRELNFEDNSLTSLPSGLYNGLDIISTSFFSRFARLHQRRYWSVGERGLHHALDISR